MNKLGGRLHAPTPPSAGIRDSAPNISHCCFLAGNAEIRVPWNVLNNTLNPGKMFQVHISGSTT